MIKPCITVLMPVYNGATHLRAAIDSILNQTLTDFEFLIIDDGSTDNTPKILAEYALKDKRIRIARNEKNLNIAGALNRGIELAAAPLIARMDADDISLPTRLEKQLAFMKQYPKISACGTAIQILNDPLCIWVPPANHDDIIAGLLFESRIYHPTIIFRKKDLLLHTKGYDIAMPPAEDYDLWVRMALNYKLKLANMQEVLLLYRIDISNKPEQYNNKMNNAANCVRNKQLNYIGIKATIDELKIHNALGIRQQNVLEHEMWACKKWFTKIFREATKPNMPYNANSLKRELYRQWFFLCTENKLPIIPGIIYFFSNFGEFSMRKILSIGKATLKKTYHLVALKLK